MHARRINLFLTLFFGSLATAIDSLPADSPRLTPVVRAVQKTLPAVVNIATEQVVRVADPYEAFFNDFFRAPARYYKRLIPLGSGVIIDPRGLVITNYHVVRRASNVEVRLVDGSAFQARPVAHDAKNDLALIQLLGDLPANRLAAMEMAQPQDLLLGETVVAVGNPFGLGHSVTTGVLSATNRHFEEGEVVFDDILQTDAAINPGNSGGPLINLDGQLIGLNLAIRRDAEGIGFALPLARIEDIVAPWLVPSKFSDGFLGLIVKTRLDQNRPQVEIVDVLPGSPAAAAGLVPGDLLVSVNDQRVGNAFAVGRQLWHLQAGDQVRLGLADGRQASLTVDRMADPHLIIQRLGLHLQALTPPLKEALGLPAAVQGLTISEVVAGSELANTGIGRGDVLMRINGQPLPRMQDLLDLLRAARSGDRVQLDILVTRPVYGELQIRPFTIRLALQ